MRTAHHVQRFWGAMDALFADVAPTPWGAVVTDGRFPRVWDANYARVDAAGVRLDDVAEALLPALRASGADMFHVVAFDPEGSRRSWPTSRAGATGWRGTS